MKQFLFYVKTDERHHGIVRALDFEDARRQVEQKFNRASIKQLEVSEYQNNQLYYTRIDS